MVNFLNWVEDKHGCSRRAPSLEYFSQLCFVDKADISKAILAFYGVLYVVPELKATLALASRSLTSFAKIRPPGEHGPWDRDGVAVVVAFILLQGEPEAALITFFYFANMASAQEWTRLRVDDVAFSAKHEEPRAGVIFGEQQRGENSGRWSCHVPHRCRRADRSHELTASTSSQPASSTGVPSYPSLSVPIADTMGHLPS